MQQRLLPGFALPPPPSLENFVPGRNLELVANLRALLGGQSPERFFYLWGEDGSGKSHLLQAIASAARNKGIHAVYASAPTECADVDLRNPDQTVFDLVALDNADRLDENAQIGLFNLYNRLREGNGCLLASGTLPPAQLQVRPDLATRLGWGLVFRVHELNDEEKNAALAAHARQRGFALPAEVSSWLLRHWRRDLPALLAVLDALDRRSMEQRRAISVPLLKELLESLNQPELFA